MSKPILLRNQLRTGLSSQVQCPSLGRARFFAPRKTPSPFPPPHRPAHNDKSDKCGRHAEGFRCLLHRLNEYLAHQSHQHCNTGQRCQSQAYGPRHFFGLSGFRAGKQLSVCLKREEHAQPVSNDEQHSQTHAQLLGKRRLPGEIGLCHRLRNQ
jgi:hypothetical protein